MWKLVPARKLEGANGRSVSLADTWSKLRPVLPLVPVTRVSDLTPLDRMGLPTFSAVTPLARDLTTHMGKGPDRESARLSALMEAMERVSAEAVPGDAAKLASLEELGGRAVSPREFTLPLRSGWNKRSLIHWAPAWDLMADQPAWIPRDLVVSPPAGEVLEFVDTNGLASGNTLLEAVLHALCEIIERDALSQLEFVSAFTEPQHGRFARVRLDTLPADLHALVEKITGQGLDLVINDIRSELRVPTFRAMIIDPRYPGKSRQQPLYSPGYGAGPDKKLAVSRAITEAVQARIGFIQGARDSFNAAPFLSRRAATALTAQLESDSTLALQELEGSSNEELMDDLVYLLNCLRSIGVSRCLVSDLTRPEWGIPVVRVRVPGLSQFAVHRNRIDRRCQRHLL